MKIANNALTGGIPSEFDHLRLLEYLNVESNALSGPIPTLFGNLGELKVLDLGMK